MSSTLDFLDKYRSVRTRGNGSSSIHYYPEQQRVAEQGIATTTMSSCESISSSCNPLRMTYQSAATGTTFLSSQMTTKIPSSYISKRSEIERQSHSFSIGATEQLPSKKLIDVKRCGGGRNNLLSTELSSARTHAVVAIEDDSQKSNAMWSESGGSPSGFRIGGDGVGWARSSTDDETTFSSVLNQTANRTFVSCGATPPSQRTHQFPSTSSLFTNSINSNHLNFASNTQQQSTQLKSATSVILKQSIQDNLVAVQDGGGGAFDSAGIYHSGFYSTGVDRLPKGDQYSSVPHATVYMQASSRPVTATETHHLRSSTQVYQHPQIHAQQLVDFTQFQLISPAPPKSSVAQHMFPSESNQLKQFSNQTPPHQPVWEYVDSRESVNTSLTSHQRSYSANHSYDIGKNFITSGKKAPRYMNSFGHEEEEEYLTRQHGNQQTPSSTATNLQRMEYNLNHPVRPTQQHQSSSSTAEIDKPSTEQSFARLSAMSEAKRQHQEEVSKTQYLRQAKTEGKASASSALEAVINTLKANIVRDLENLQKKIVVNEESDSESLQSSGARAQLNSLDFRVEESFPAVPLFEEEPIHFAYMKGSFEEATVVLEESPRVSERLPTFSSPVQNERRACLAKVPYTEKKVRQLFLSDEFKESEDNTMQRVFDVGVKGIDNSAVEAAEDDDDEDIFQRETTPRKTAAAEFQPLIRNDFNDQENQATPCFERAEVNQHDSSSSIRESKMQTTFTSAVESSTTPFSLLPQTTHSDTLMKDDYCEHLLVLSKDIITESRSFTKDEYIEERDEVVLRSDTQGSQVESPPRGEVFLDLHQTPLSLNPLNDCDDEFRNYFNEYIGSVVVQQKDHHQQQRKLSLSRSSYNDCRLYSPMRQAKRENESFSLNGGMNSADESPVMIASPEVVSGIGSPEIISQQVVTHIKQYEPAADAQEEQENSMESQNIPRKERVTSFSLFDASNEQKQLQPCTNEDVQSKRQTTIHDVSTNPTEETIGVSSRVIANSSESTLKHTQSVISSFNDQLEAHPHQLDTAAPSQLEYYSSPAETKQSTPIELHYALDQQSVTSTKAAVQPSLQDKADAAVPLHDSSMKVEEDQLQPSSVSSIEDGYIESDSAVKQHSILKINSPVPNDVRFSTYLLQHNIVCNGNQQHQHPQGQVSSSSSLTSSSNLPGSYLPEKVLELPKNGRRGRLEIQQMFFSPVFQKPSNTTATLNSTFSSVGGSRQYNQPKLPIRSKTPPPRGLHCDIDTTPISLNDVITSDVQRERVLLPTRLFVEEGSQEIVERVSPDFLRDRRSTSIADLSIKSSIDLGRNRLTCGVQENNIIDENPLTDNECTQSSSTLEETQELVLVCSKRESKQHSKTILKNSLMGSPTLPLQMNNSRTVFNPLSLKKSQKSISFKVNIEEVYNFQPDKRGGERSRSPILANLISRNRSGSPFYDPSRNQTTSASSATTGTLAHSSSFAFNSSSTTSSSTSHQYKSQTATKHRQPSFQQSTQSMLPSPSSNGPAKQNVPFGFVQRRGSSGTTNQTFKTVNYGSTSSSKPLSFLEYQKIAKQSNAP